MKPSKKAAGKPRESKARSADQANGNPNRLGSFWLTACVVGMVFACIWSYWPNFVEIVRLWESEPDYSHGYLVLPIALAFLWFRRDQFPQEAIRPALLSGLCVVALSVAVRFLAARYFYGPIDNWTLLLWLSGTVLTFFGWRVLWWSFPSIFFLWFAMPLPYRLEIMLRLPLQRVATEISTMCLVMLGQPAIAEANVIRIGEQVFGVEEACSGLRIFFGIAALAFAFVVLSRRVWITRILIIISILPIAVIANATRIVITCLLYQNVGSEAAKRFSHDFAGFLMIPFAGVLFGLTLWVLARVFREIDVVGATDLFRRPGAADRPS